MTQDDPYNVVIDAHGEPIAEVYDRLRWQMSDTGLDTLAQIVDDVLPPLMLPLITPPDLRVYDHASQTGLDILTQVVGEQYP